jgi:hypothetical protein
VIVAGDPVAPEDVTVMCPVYVPAVSEPSVADICKLCGAAPLAGLTPSHAESLVAVKFSVPVPVFVTLTEPGVGFVPLPCVALNVNDVPDSDRTG